MQKRALITGIAGLNGSYLSKFLLEKGYEVHGLSRRQEPHPSFQMHSIDITDGNAVAHVVEKVCPHEIYNLAFIGDEPSSWITPELSMQIDGLGPLRLLEAIRTLDLQGHTRFFQASTASSYGLVQEVPQTEHTHFRPRSPYSSAKVFAYWTTINYRESYGIHASNGILFTHEGLQRGTKFVSRKISQAVVNIYLGKQQQLRLGNLSAQRDWGHAQDFVDAEWRMLQQDQPGDYIIATGKQNTVRDFVTYAFHALGISLRWSGESVKETAVVVSAPSFAHHLEGRVVVSVDPAFFRPTEASNLLGDFSKAKRDLGWEPKISFKEIVSEMVREDLSLLAPFQKPVAGTLCEESSPAPVVL